MTYVSNKPMKKIISILFTLMISFSFMITSSFASYSDASNLSANQNYLDGEILVKIKSDKNIEQVISASLNIANSQNSEFAEKIRRLRNHGRGTGTDIEVWGLNCRMDNLHAAILNYKLKFLPEWLKRRREIAAIPPKAIESTLVILEIV